MARPCAIRERPFQRRRLRLVRQPARPCHYQPPCCSRAVTEGLEDSDRILERRLLRENAKTPAEEIKCSDLELNVLVSYENVTDRIRSAVKAEMSQQDAVAARRAEIARITRESTEATKLRSDVVTLYQGGEYWLYRYKK